MLRHQKAPKIKLESAAKIPAITSFAALGLVREALDKFGLIAAMKRFRLKRAGFGDDVILEALILLLASGGRSLSDWEYLQHETGFARMFGACPSVDTLERYLRRLTIEVPTRKSDKGQVGFSQVLEQLHDVLAKKAYALAGNPKFLTLDMDATLIATKNREALYSYEKTKAYQPFIVYCPELRMVVAHEFRDGNVSPAEGHRRLVERCQRVFPGVHLTVRADSAGYENDFLDWMTKERIRYYITADQTESLQERLVAEQRWRPLIVNDVNTGQEIATIVYAPDARSQKEQAFRIHTRDYIATRKEKEQPELFDKYIYHVIVTNAVRASPEDVVQKHRGRCGTVEYANQQIKSQCGMDMMPSNEFLVNAAWFSLGCLTHNILRVIQEHLLPDTYRRFELQTLRFRFLRSAAIVVNKVRYVVLRFCKDHSVYHIYRHAQTQLACLAG